LKKPNLSLPTSYYNSKSVFQNNNNGLCLSSSTRKKKEDNNMNTIGIRIHECTCPYGQLVDEKWRRVGFESKECETSADSTENY
jgi:hypothetical protein